MLKKIISLFVAGMFWSAQLSAGNNVVYSQNLISETALTYNNNYVLDLDKYNISELSVESVFSSATIPAVTFADGTVSTMSVSVVDFASLNESRGSGTITVLSSQAVAGSSATDTISVAGTTTAIVAAGTNARLSLNRDTFTFTIDFQIGRTSTDTAVNIANMLNIRAYNITASTTGTGSTVTVRANQMGTYANSYTLTSSSPSVLTVGSRLFTSGADPVEVRINGKSFKSGVQFQAVTSSQATAGSLYNAVNADADVTSVLSVSSASGQITLTAKSTGTAYTYPLYTSSQTALTLSGVSSTWSGSTVSATSPGRDSAVFALNGRSFRAGYGFTSATDAATTAKNLSNALMANASIAALITSTWSASGVVTATSTAVGAGVNYTLRTSTQAALTLNVPITAVGGAATGVMQGGTASNVNTATGVISKSNTFTTALQVLYTKTAGQNPGTLSPGTTYFVSNPTSSKFQLIDTSTGAQAGISIAISSQGTGGGSYTLTPLPYTGSAAFKWQVSNDNTNWVDMSIATNTVFVTSASSFTYTDMGVVRARYVRAAVTAPTSGGLALTSNVHAK